MFVLAASALAIAGEVPDTDAPAPAKPGPQGTLRFHNGDSLRGRLLELAPGPKLRWLVRRGPDEVWFDASGVASFEASQKPHDTPTGEWVVYLRNGDWMRCGITGLDE
jgi:hypothetical protein